MVNNVKLNPDGFLKKKPNHCTQVQSFPNFIPRSFQMNKRLTMGPVFIRILSQGACTMRTLNP